MRPLKIAKKHMKISINTSQMSLLEERRKQRLDESRGGGGIGGSPWPTRISGLPQSAKRGVCQSCATQMRRVSDKH